MPTFAQNFQGGDVVYGISQSRDKYQKSLPAALVKQCQDDGTYITCDHYNNRTFLQVGKSNVALNNKLDIQNTFQLNQQDDNTFRLNGNQRKELKDYFESLAASPRSPADAFDLADKKIRAKGNDDRRDMMIRRACKFCIEYMIMTLNRQVHFVLDLPDVVTTGTDGVNRLVPSGQVMSDADTVDKLFYGTHVSITTSELRCCFRNWGTWGPTGRLKFYNNLNEVQAPWLSNPTEWNRYAQYRVLKQQAAALKQKTDAWKSRHPVLSAFTKFDPAKSKH